MEKIHNTHIHIFTDKDVPDRFLPLHLVPFLRNKICNKIFTKILKAIIPSDKDILDRYANFVQTGKLGSQSNILHQLEKYYPDNTEYWVLTMDMSCMGAGKVPRNYLEQLNELGRLKKIKNIKIFVHIDPRNDIFDEFVKFHKRYGVQGIKIYPPLGYSPNNYILEKYYNFCEENNLQVISHCSPFNPVRYRGSKKEIKKLLLKEGIEYDNKMNKKELCSLFTHPINWIPVLENHKNLNICLAHFGSEYYWNNFLKSDFTDNWFLTIRKMLEDFPNLYTDISFTLNDEKYFAILENILDDAKISNKILFGSDYYMNETKCTEDVFCKELRKYLGEEKWKLISETNPLKFKNNDRNKPRPNHI